MAEYRVQKDVQTELERLWSERMVKDDKIMTNRYEILNLQVTRFSQEIVNLEERHNGSAASTVDASSGRGGSTSNFAAHVMPNPFTPTRVELKKAGRSGGTSVELGSLWMRPGLWKATLKPSSPMPI